MDIWINMGFAWLSVILTILLSVIYILRLTTKNNKDSVGYFSKFNRFLRKHHKLMGIGLVLTGLIHGVFSSDDVLSLNIGTLAWVVSILLGINFMIRNKIGKIKGWIVYHRLLTVLFLMTIVWHVVDVGGITVQNLSFEDGGVASTVPVITPLTTTSTDDALILADGTYSGEATGYRAGLQVSVDVVDGAIADIVVTDHNEVNSKYYAEPIETIPKAIIEAQTTDVDTVSGATFTSVGIINAVNDALSDALVSGTLPETQTLPESHAERGGRHKIKP